MLPGVNQRLFVSWILAYGQLHFRMFQLWSEEPNTGPVRDCEVREMQERSGY